MKAGLWTGVLFSLVLGTLAIGTYEADQSRDVLVHQSHDGGLEVEPRSWSRLQLSWPVPPEIRASARRGDVLIADIEVFRIPPRFGWTARRFRLERDGLTVARWRNFPVPLPLAGASIALLPFLAGLGLGAWIGLRRRPGR